MSNPRCRAVACMSTSTQLCCSRAQTRDTQKHSIYCMRSRSLCGRRLLVGAAQASSEYICAQRNTTAQHVCKQGQGWHMRCAKAGTGNLNVTCRLRSHRVQPVDAASLYQAWAATDASSAQRTKACVSMHMRRETLRRQACVTAALPKCESETLKHGPPFPRPHSP